MPTVRELIASPVLSPSISALSDTGLDREVASVRLVEYREQIARAPANALVILTDGAIDGSSSFYLDIALREAIEREAACLVVRLGRSRLIGASTNALARRADIGLLRLSPVAELAQLTLALQREISPDADGSLTRLDALRRVVDEADPQLSPNALLEQLRAAGLRLDTVPADSDRGTPIAGDPQPESRVVAEIADRRERELVQWLVAEALGRASQRTRDAQESSIQSRSELITELLGTEPQDAPPLIRRARQLGIAVDGWHAIIALAPEFDHAFDPLARTKTAGRIGRLATDTARASGGGWHRARLGEHLLLVLMEREEPGGHADTSIVRTTGRVLDRLRRAEPSIPVYCGVSALHPGASGLWTCLLEARTAARTARLSGSPQTPVFFDATGVDQTIAEWYGSEAARKRVAALLAPLEALDARRKAEALQTLRAYFDNGSSTTRAAEALYLHRNTVAYRVQRLAEILEVDIDDPDRRLLLQLACRAYELSQARPTP